MKIGHSKTLNDKDNSLSLNTVLTDTQKIQRNNELQKAHSIQYRRVKHRKIDCLGVMEESTDRCRIPIDAVVNDKKFRGIRIAIV